MFRWFRRSDRVSLEWLRNQDRRESRIDFQSAQWRFPVRKLINEAANMNRYRLKRKVG